MVLVAWRIDAGAVSNGWFDPFREAEWRRFLSKISLVQRPERAQVVDSIVTSQQLLLPNRATTPDDSSLVVPSAAGVPPQRQPRSRNTWAEEPDTAGQTCWRTIREPGRWLL